MKVFSLSIRRHLTWKSNSLTKTLLMIDCITTKLRNLHVRSLKRVISTFRQLFISFQETDSCFIPDTKDAAYVNSFTETKEKTFWSLLVTIVSISFVLTNGFNRKGLIKSDAPLAFQTSKKMTSWRRNKRNEQEGQLFEIQWQKASLKMAKSRVRIKREEISTCI